MGREEVEAVPRMSLALKGLYPKARSRERKRAITEVQAVSPAREKTDDAHHAQQGKANGGREDVIEKPGGGSRRVTFARDHDAFPF
jgi:hypothetical protein